jgi:hypothetical protein
MTIQTRTKRQRAARKAAREKLEHVVRELGRFDRPGERILDRSQRSAQRRRAGARGSAQQVVGRIKNLA